jgi:SSS family solute:Na+ symporter/sodium/proline symporter
MEGWLKMNTLFQWLALGAFVMMMIGVGLFTIRRTRTTSDFFLGGRKIGPWISAFAYGTTYFSAVIFVGYAGTLGFQYGLPVLWIAIGNTLIGSLLAWLVLARKTRSMTVRLNVITMPEFLEKRYDSKVFKIVGALVIFIFMVPYSGSVYTGLSFLFVNVLGIGYNQALCFMALLTAIYLTLGGYSAISLSSFIQGLIMLVGVALMVAYTLTHPSIGGFGNLLIGLKKVDPELIKVFPANGASLLWLVILTSLGVWGLPQMIQKFYAIRNEKVITTATVVGTIFCLVIAGAAYFIGSTSSMFSQEIIKQNPEAFSGDAVAAMNLAEARTVLGKAMNNNSYANTALIPQILKMALPHPLLILLLLLVLSASMSTLSSVVLVSSSAIVVDLIQGYFLPNLSRRWSVFLMRVLCLFFVGISLITALYGAKWPYLVALMSFSWGTISGAFLAPYLYGLFWKGVTKAGAWAGFFSGLGFSVITFLCYMLHPELQPFIKDIAPMVGSISMLLPLVVVPVVSWLTPKFSKEHLDWVFGVEKVHESVSLVSKKAKERKVAVG